MNSISSIYALQRELDTELSFLTSARLSADKDEEHLDNLLSEQRAIIKEFEDSIVKHRRIIAAIQTRRNSYIPKISTLPPEILIEIFTHLRNFPSDTPRYGWLKAAHVCRYWRDVILSCPRLFSVILLPIRDFRHLEEFLRLSGTLPLTVRAAGEYSDSDNDHDQYMASWQVIAPHLSRTESLGMWVDPNDSIVWPQLPLMHEFLWNAYSHHPERDPGKFPEETVRHILASMSNLRFLRFNTGTMGGSWFRMPLAPTLTDLYIDHHQNMDGNASLWDLGVALAALPSLINLGLDGFTEDDYHMPSRLPYAAWPPLPRLHFLRLDGSLDGVLNVLKLPFRAAAVSVDVNRVEYDEQHHELLSLPCALMTILQGGQPGLLKPQVHELYISLTHFDKYCSHSAEIQGLGVGNVRSPFSLFFRCERAGASEFFPILKTLTNDFLPLLSNIHALRIEEYLHVTDRRTTICFDLLSEHEIAHHLGLAELLDITDGTVPFPRLQIVEVRFQRKAVRFANLVLKSLIEPLTARLDNGYKLDTLQIKENYSVKALHRIEEDVVEELSALVGKAELTSEVSSDRRYYPDWPFE